MRAFALVPLLLFAAVPALAVGLDADRRSAFDASTQALESGGGFRETRLETLWIFDDDFSTDMGWTAYDLSGTLGQENHWHHDTIRLTQPYLGTSTWWCGTYDPCWRQPRGYGNNWIQHLLRTMVEVGAESAPGDEVILEFDQRYAMERNYDYGYVDVRRTAEAEWTTLAAYNNPGFQGAGVPHDWNHPVDGHASHDLSAYAGQEIELRFRFESDEAYSSQDVYDNPQHSVRDGAWQWDNLTITANGDTIFYDDAESGNMGWIHDDVEAAGQTGVTWWRGRYKIDCQTSQTFTCDEPPYGTWMYWAVDPFSCKMVDNEYAALVSPPIDISGAQKLVGAGHLYIDCAPPTNDVFNLYLASNDVPECIQFLDGFVDEDPGWWYGSTTAFWDDWVDDWDAFTGNDWLAVRWDVLHDEPGEPHGSGLFVNRQRVGIPSGDVGTTFDRDAWNTFRDWFDCELAEALVDTASIRVKDDDGIQSVYLLATSDGGATWESYECQRESPESDWWRVPPPSMAPHTEILYYYEATDGVGNVAVYPSTAPSRTFEFSILPLEATVEDPGLLLVDKHGRRTPGAERDYGFSDPRGHYKCYSEYYYREALEILGYDWETYDVDVPSGSVQSQGPDTCGMKYYSTQIWFTNDFSAYTLWPIDQYNLIQWLAEAGEGKERNLFLTGNDIGRELVGSGVETLNFYTTWLASQYVADAVGLVTVDSVPGLQDHPGGYGFMPDDGDPSTPIDGDCALQGGCPVLMSFDVIDARPGIAGSEVALDYKKLDMTLPPAGVAYTHQTLGYRTVNLGFGFEFMRDGTCFGGAFYTPEGYHVPGIHHRVQLMGNILDYFGRIPDGPGTGVPEGALENVLSHAYPNPFNPVTRIDYSVKEAGPVTIRIHNVAGRVVRTLLDTELETGALGHVVWDGTNDRGERCASGVYFYRITTPDFAATRKMVMLK